MPRLPSAASSFSGSSAGAARGFHREDAKNAKDKALRGIREAPTIEGYEMLLNRGLGIQVSPLRESSYAKAYFQLDNAARTAIVSSPIVNGLARNRVCPAYTP